MATNAPSIINATSTIHHVEMIIGQMHNTIPEREFLNNPDLPGFYMRDSYMRDGQLCACWSFTDLRTATLFKLRFG